MDARSAATRFAAYSAAGGVLEWGWRGEMPRSAIFAKQPVPFLPIYGLGGVALAAIASHVKGEDWLSRFGAYAAALTALELVSCKVGKAVYGYVGWEYDGGACVDIGHSIAWGALGLALECIDPKVFR